MTRPCSERGTGVLSTTFGVGVVLLLLFSAAHVLLNLWVRSTVESVTTDAATRVALSRAAPGDLAAVQRRAVADARSDLGSYGERVQMDFETDPAGRSVILHVRAPAMNLVPRLLGSDLGLGDIDRRIVVTREVAH